MARPSKNSCDYFPHDNGMRNHVKIKAIRNKFEKGYSIWVMFLEFLTGSDGNVFEYNDLQFELLSGDFGVSVTEIKNVIDYALKLELIFNENGFLFSESLNERLAPVYQKRGKSKDKSSKQKRLNGQFVSNNTESTVVSATEIPQSKVKEIKVKKKRAEKEFIPPTPLEIENYFVQNGYSKESAKKAFNFYDCENWYDSKGNKVKSWKQKAQSVWFKEENKSNVTNAETTQQASDEIVWQKLLDLAKIYKVPQDHLINFYPKGYDELLKICESGKIEKR